jgi:hypothetical protein
MLHVTLGKMLTIISRNDQAFITLKGLKYNNFKWLGGLLKPIHNNESPWVLPNGTIFPIQQRMGCLRLIHGANSMGLWVV